MYTNLSSDYNFYVKPYVLTWSLVILFHRYLHDRDREPLSLERNLEMLLLTDPDVLALNKLSLLPFTGGFTTRTIVQPLTRMSAPSTMLCPAFAQRHSPTLRKAATSRVHTWASTRFQRVTTYGSTTVVMAHREIYVRMERSIRAKILAYAHVTWAINFRPMEAREAFLLQCSASSWSSLGETRKQGGKSHIHQQSIKQCSRLSFIITLKKLINIV